MPNAIIQAVLSGDNEELQRLLEATTLKIEDLREEEKRTGYTAFDRAVLMNNRKAQDLISNAFSRFKYKELEEKNSALLRKSFQETPDLFLKELNKLVEKQELEKIKQLIQYKEFEHLEPILAMADQEKPEDEKHLRSLRYGCDDIYIPIIIVAIQQNKYELIKSLPSPIFDILYQERRLLDWVTEQKEPEIYNYLYTQSQNPLYILNRCTDNIDYRRPRYKYSDEDLQRFGHTPKIVDELYKLVLIDYRKDSYSLLVRNALDPAASLGKVFFVNEPYTRGLLKELMKKTIIAKYEATGVARLLDKFYMHDHSGIMRHLIKDNYDIDLISLLFSFPRCKLIFYCKDLLTQYLHGEGVLPKLIQIAPEIEEKILERACSLFDGVPAEKIYGDIEKYNDKVLEILGKQPMLKENILKCILTHPLLSIVEKRTVLSTVYKDAEQADDKQGKPTKALTKLFLAKRRNTLPNYTKGIFEEITKTIARLDDQIKKNQVEEEKTQAFIKKKEIDRDKPYTLNPAIYGIHKSNEKKRQLLVPEKTDKSLEESLTDLNLGNF